MAPYHRLSLVEREELSRMLATGASLRAIRQARRRAPSTLSRALTRHQASPVTYRAVPAHHRAQRWAHQPRKPRKLAIQLRLRTAVFTLLAQRWSPSGLKILVQHQYPGRTSGPIAKGRFPCSGCVHGLVRSCKIPTGDGTEAESIAQQSVHEGQIGIR